METKTCTRCKLEKPKDKKHFEWVPPGPKAGKGYFRGRCKKCQSEAQVARAKRYRTDPTPRVCATCGKRGTRAEFKGRSYCPPCQAAHQAVAQARFLAKQGGASRYQRNTYLKRTYGITIEEYEEMLAAQGGKCAICPATEGASDRLSFCVDHNHVTGKRRKLLCVSCNFRVRNLGDDLDLFELTVAYIREHLELVA